MDNKKKSIQIFGRVIPFTKEKQKSFADALAKKVTDGEVDPIKMFLTAKAMLESLNLFLKNKEVMDSTLSACKKFGQTGAIFNGANLCATEAGVKYDYSVCKDPEWEDLSKQRAEIDEKLKTREKFLRGITGSQVLANEKTGKKFTVFAPAMSSSTTVKVTFAK